MPAAIQISCRLNSTGVVSVRHRGRPITIALKPHAVEAVVVAVCCGQVRVGDGAYSSASIGLGTHVSVGVVGVA